MVYFDTDVLVHYFVAYDHTKHQQASQLAGQAIHNHTFFISLLSLQELVFVMAKLKQPLPHINQITGQLLATGPVPYDAAHFSRASHLAQQVGFQNINDCLHAAIAEMYCTELITFNKSDFNRIQSFTPLKITIL
jgi:predicted nucleic acid-binding protein